MLAVACPLIACLVACQPSSDSANQSKARAKDVYSVQLTDMPVQRLFSATVTAKDAVKVHSQVTGIVSKLMYQQGQWVKVGDPLYQLETKPFLTNINQSKSALQQAQASLRSAKRASQQAKAMLATDKRVLKQAKADLERYQLLIADNAVSEQAYQQAVSHVQIAQSSVGRSRALIAQTRADIKAKKAQLKYATQLLKQNKQALQQTLIKAPVAGMIIDSNIQQGDKITAESDSYITIGQLSPIFVDIALSTEEWLGLQANTDFANTKLVDDKSIDNPVVIKDQQIKLVLNNGKVYAQSGKLIAQETVVKKSGITDFNASRHQNKQQNKNQQNTDKVITNITSNPTNPIILRALFANKDKKLLPNMQVQALIDIPTVKPKVKADSTTQSADTQTTQVALLPVEAIHALPILLSNSSDHHPIADDLISKQATTDNSNNIQKTTSPEHTVAKDNAKSNTQNSAKNNAKHMTTVQPFMASQPVNYKYFVYLHNDDKQIVRQFVTIDGLSANNQVIVTNGLNQGDQVLLQPPVYNADL